MKSTTHIIIIGASGVAGRLHQSCYQDIGITSTVLVDKKDWHQTEVLDLLDMVKLPVQWSDIIVDICTPTALHGSTILAAYERGARHFIVEKPADISAHLWRQVMSATPEAHYFICHNYLFSKAFEVTEHYLTGGRVGSLASMTSLFSKDRRHESLRGRGTDSTGVLPHAFLIESPHQVALMHALVGRIPIIDAVSWPMQIGGRIFDTHGGGMITLADDQHSVRLSTSLQGHRERAFTISSETGKKVCITFPIDASLCSQVVVTDRDKPQQLLFAGPDNSLCTTLSAAISALQHHVIPQVASATLGSHASVVMPRLARCCAL